MTASASSRPPDAFWMPFTPNRAFRNAPRLFVRAQGMHYFTPEGRRILDTLAGLWCVNAGHGNPRIVRAIQAQAAELDFVSSFNMSHPLAFEAATRLASLAPAGLSRVFFSNSGSEAVDSALKIARAYHTAPAARAAGYASSVAPRPITASGGADCPSGAWRATSASSRPSSAMSITCLCPTISAAPPSRAASRSTAHISPRSSSPSSPRSTIRRPSRR